MNKKIKQAIILAAGHGTRMGPLGRIYYKVELLIGNKPLFEHHIDFFIKIRILNIIFVVSPQSENLMKRIAEYTMKVSSEMKVEFVVQDKPRGIAQALNLCRENINSSFVLLLGDTYFIAKKYDKVFKMIEGKDFDCILSVRKESDEDLIKKECTIELNADDCVQRIVEKPKKVLSDLKPCGIYQFSEKIFDAIDKTPVSSLRNEVELTDAIQVLIDDLCLVSCAHVISVDVNIGTVADLLRANKIHLSGSGRDTLVSEKSEIGNNVNIMSSVIADNVIIEEGAVIQNSVILPGVRVEKGSVIDGELLFVV